MVGIEVMDELKKINPEELVDRSVELLKNDFGDESEIFVTAWLIIIRHLKSRQKIKSD